MARIAAKMIERKLEKDGINLDGYQLLEFISNEWMRYANQNGMSNGITEPFDFEAFTEVGDAKLTFECSMEEDYKQINDEEIPYYFLCVHRCKILDSENNETYIEIDVYEK